MSFFTSLHLLNFKQLGLQHTDDVDCIKFNTKYCCPHGQYSAAKTEYFQGRCSNCDQHRRVKQNLKYVDKLLKTHTCLFLSWDLNQPLILFFSNGSIVTMKLNEKNNTLLEVAIDNNLCGKFIPSRIVDVVFAKNFIYITYIEPKLTLIRINQDSPSIISKLFGHKKGKLVGFEPKIITFDLFEHKTKCVERKLSLNIQRDLLLVWWKNSSDDVWPWTPISFLTDRVNMLLYAVNGANIDLMCSIKVQDHLLHASFSKELANQFFSLEEIKKEGGTVVNLCIHEIIHGNCQLIYTSELPLRGNLVAFQWSSTEDKLLAADSDGLLLIFDVRKRSTIVTNLEFLPKHLSWHPQNCIVLIVSKSNHVLCLDASLNIINFKLCHKTSLELKTLELNSHISGQFSVQKVLWQDSVFNDTCLFVLDSEYPAFVFMKFSFGCITRHNITAFELISQYLKTNSIDEAILILKSLDWCYKSDVKFQCLSKIVNCLLRKPLNFTNENGIELALNTFYDWVELIPERIVKMYEHRMHHLSRRFFHHLIRYYRFRKALLLAIELDSQDLFFDLYHVAKQKGDNILAGVALNKAEEFNESSESCSESCSSDCQSESSNSNDITYTIPYRNSPRNERLWSEIPHNNELKSSHLQVQNKKPPTNKYNQYGRNSVGYKIEAQIEENAQIHSIRENFVIEEENEEMEGTQIKLDHLGVI